MKSKPINRLINEPMPVEYAILFSVFITATFVMIIGLIAMFGTIEDRYIAEYGTGIPTHDWCIFWFNVATYLMLAMIPYVAIAILVEVLALRKEEFDASDVMCGLSWYLNSRKEDYCAFLETDPEGDKSKLTLNSIAEIDFVLSEITRIQKVIEEE